MNTEQELWWRQAQSDFAIFVKLRKIGAHECHLLHYLQMATEKFSKANSWKGGRPRESHVAFKNFLKNLQGDFKTPQPAAAPDMGPPSNERSPFQLPGH